MKKPDNPNKIQGPRPMLELIARTAPKPPSALRNRLFDLPLPDTDEAILYQHSVLCQTCLPFRDPGNQVRSVERANGLVSLVVAAGQAFHPDTRRFVDVGLPYGPKPRLVLYHLNAEALRTQSPVIELEDSLTAFVKRTLGLDSGGRTIRTVKDQLTRLSAADFRIGTVVSEGRAVTLKGCVIEGFDLWVTKDVQQRTLWPTTVQFSQRYFESLTRHAVPLNETAIARLSHNAMALDIYTWLAQRLNRIGEGKSVLVPWASLWEQFGHGYARIRRFRSVFTSTLKQVKVVYPDAKFDLSAEGMQLKHSRPPVARRLLPMSPS
jgi:hypothetical protein